MATEVVKIVDPNNNDADYTSLASWEADFGSCTQSNYPSMSGDGDLVGADLIAVADCRCSTGDADTDAVTVDGWTSTGADNYIKIWTDPDQGYRHDGKWNMSAYRSEISASGKANILIKESYTKVQGLQVKTSTASGDYQYGIRAESEAGNVVISHCVVKCGNTSATYCVGIKIHSGAGDYNSIYNNIVYGFSGANQSGIENGTESYIYNNTVVNNNKGICSDGWKGERAKNNLAFNNTDDYDCPYWGEAVYNAYSEGTDPGTNGLDISSYAGTDIFVDYNNDDFHLKSDSPCKDAGTDLSSDSYLSFTDDIDGETRSTPWDIGADEYVSGGGGETITLTAMSLQYAGQSLFTNETFNLQPLSLSFTGKNLSINEILTLVRNSLSFSGKNLLLNEAVSLNRGTLAFTGKTLFFNETVKLVRQALSWAGAELAVIQGYIVKLTAGTLSWAGKNLYLNEVYSLVKGVITFTGKALTALTGETVTLVKGTLSWTGKAIKINEAVNLAKGTLKFTGKILKGLGGVIRSELSIWLKIK